MGNLTSFEVNLDDFNIEDPTPLDNNQKLALDRGKDNGRVDFSLNSLVDVPIQVFTLTNLTSLNLSVNKLRYLPSALWQMSRLETLDLSSNELEDLPPEIAMLTNLQILTLRHNSLTVLPETFGNLASLQKVNLEYNRLKTLPSLEKLTALSELRLRYNKIRRISRPVGCIKGTLDIPNNTLCSFPPCETLGNLSELVLENNVIDTLPSAISHLSGLSKLIMPNNRIDALPPEIRHLTSLVELDMRENRIRSVPPDIGCLQALKKLNLANNKIRSLPSEIWSLPSLMVLNVGHNEMDELPGGMTGKVTTLKELLLGGNRFAEIPPEVTQLPLLACLFLGWNRISRVDPSIAAMQKLTILSLSGNRISELPAEIGGLRCLKELYLAANELTMLPESLCELKVLEILDIRHNKLSYVPPSLKALNFLERIDISDNPQIPLPKELLEKKSLTLHQFCTKNADRYTVAQADMRGKRWNMEDAMVAVCGYRGKQDEHLFAVFDGHGGDKAAIQAAERFPAILADMLAELESGKTEPDEDDVVEAIKAAFVECSKEMTPDNIRRSGTTAIAVLCSGPRMYVANVGDSRAVACGGGLARSATPRHPAPPGSGALPAAAAAGDADVARTSPARRISVDHKPDLPEEEKRIRNLGGFVSPNGRVVGMLAVSRAFGDLELQPFVSADPHVDVFDISDPPEFVVVACDGVWDVVSDQAACEIVATELDDVSKACMKLRDFAYLFGSQDNISVIVIKLDKDAH